MSDYDRDEERALKIESYQYDDEGCHVRKSGVLFRYDGDNTDGWGLESIEIEDPEILLGEYEVEWLEELTEGDDEDLRSILSYCWLLQKQAALKERNEENRKKGLLQLIPKIESIHLDGSCEDFLENLLNPEPGVD